MLMCDTTMNLAEQRYVFEWGREGWCSCALMCM